MTAAERVTAAFRDANASGRAALVGYLTAGFPDDDTFLRDARAVLEHADVLELGLPFSDPLGDGPTVQASSQHALDRGVTTARVLELLSVLTAASDKPILVMTYCNPILGFRGGTGPDAGAPGFVAALAAAGGAGMILPDMPPEEGGDVARLAEERGLATVFLAAPTSTHERLRLVGSASSGFVYAVSVTGVTGARAQVAADLPDYIGRLRRATDLPIGVGFGVSSGETAAEVAAVADGVVVGSALISRQAGGEELEPFMRELAAACVR